MDVNSREWSQRQFKENAVACKNFNAPMYKRTTYICKDYMCPLVKQAETIEDLKILFERNRKV
jgi:hypothetical protein